MSTPRPTPSTDMKITLAGTYTFPGSYTFPELAALIAERDQLRADCENETKWAAHYLAQSIADKARAERAEAAFADPQQLHAHCLRTLNEGQIAHLFGGRMTEIVNRAEAELATERARLDSGQILLTVAGERVWHCGVDLRAAIDAGMREDAK